MCGGDIQDSEGILNMSHLWRGERRENNLGGGGGVSAEEVSQVMQGGSRLISGVLRRREGYWEGEGGGGEDLVLDLMYGRSYSYPQILRRILLSGHMEESNFASCNLALWVILSPSGGGGGGVWGRDSGWR